MVRDFGTTRGTGAGRPTSAPPVAPCGLSAVSRNNPRCPTASSAVVALPPCLAALGTAFRRSSGTVRPSDFSRPLAISSFRPRWLPLSVARGGGREISPGKIRKTSCRHRRHYACPPNGYWAIPLSAGLPRDIRLTTLCFRSMRHCTLDFHRTPPRGPASSSVPLGKRPRIRGPVLRPGALVSSVWGSLRQGPQRTYTSCLAPMPGARRVARGGYPPPALTEPDLWFSHPALRDAGVGVEAPIPAPVNSPGLIPVTA
jgi:hypothetical protein